MNRNRLVQLCLGLILAVIATIPLYPQASSSPLNPTILLRKSVAEFKTGYRNDSGEYKTIDGTCFFVFYDDKRVGPRGGFNYLVTNKHMAKPFIEGRLIPPSDYWIRLSKKQYDPSVFDAGNHLSPANSVDWQFSDDSSVDLAVIPYNLNWEDLDVFAVPRSWFVLDEHITNGDIGEGDSLILTGYFYQFPGRVRFEPIVRHGILAMLPREKLVTTLGGHGKLYLADIHSFHGNSGSPVFVNLGYNRQTGRVHLNYKLLGVLSGGYIEETPFKVKVVTPIDERLLEGRGEGAIGANSEVATIVPATELLRILENPILRRGRDEAVKNLSNSSVKR